MIINNQYLLRGPSVFFYSSGCHSAKLLSIFCLSFLKEYNFRLPSAGRIYQSKRYNKYLLRLKHILWFGYCISPMCVCVCNIICRPFGGFINTHIYRPGYSRYIYIWVGIGEAGFIVVFPHMYHIVWRQWLCT